MLVSAGTNRDAGRFRSHVSEPCTTAMLVEHGVS